MAAMRTGTPLATWRVMTDRGPDATSGGSSTPSLTGPGCITIDIRRVAQQAFLGQAPARRVRRFRRRAGALQPLSLDAQCHHGRGVP